MNDRNNDVDATSAPNSDDEVPRSDAGSLRSPDTPESRGRTLAMLSCQKEFDLIYEHFLEVEHPLSLHRKTEILFGMVNLIPEEARVEAGQKVLQLIQIHEDADFARLQLDAEFQLQDDAEAARALAEADLAAQIQGDAELAAELERNPMPVQQQTRTKRAARPEQAEALKQLHNHPVTAENSPDLATGGTTTTTDTDDLVLHPLSELGDRSKVEEDRAQSRRIGGDSANDEGDDSGEASVGLKEENNEGAEGEVHSGEHERFPGRLNSQQIVPETTISKGSLDWKSPQQNYQMSSWDKLSTDKLCSVVQSKMDDTSEAETFGYDVQSFEDDDEYVDLSSGSEQVAVASGTAAQQQYAASTNIEPTSTSQRVLQLKMDDTPEAETFGYDVQSLEDDYDYLDLASIREQVAVLSGTAAQQQYAASTNVESTSTSQQVQKQCSAYQF